MSNSIQYKLGLKNDSQFDFKTEKTLDQRISLSEHHNKSHPEYAVVVCEPHRSFKQDKNKLKKPLLLIKRSDTLINLQRLIVDSLKIQIQPNETLYFFSQNVMLMINDSIQNLSDRYRDKEDNILYLKFVTQDGFGSNE